MFRITLARYAGELKAFGRAALWNSNDVDVIYTSSSQSLACLENVVHRNSLGLNALFKVMSIEIPDNLSVETINLKNLKEDWSSFRNISNTQKIGDEWVKLKTSPVLKVPSSIIPSEFNFLINPLHPDFKRVKLLGSEIFVFDKRIKDK
ncbi:RES family NAD+ phosphorylase [Pseudopedobacter saltans]|uniref:RES family NAD+ phosphorylase n=1 Tax=Pseudopedobacter saltans TaxID=151895 RepID=UPI001FE0A8E6|nr:RES family NAD+ phosphorylase [Pseudopedobacter saltans]